MLNNLVDKALTDKLVYEKSMGQVCDYLNNICPYSCLWYFNSAGFVQVDVPFDDVDGYIQFVENMVECRYTSIRNLNGVTLMISLSTLNNIL